MTNIDQFGNYARSTLAGGASGAGTQLLSTDTQLYLQSGDGAKFPAAGPFNLLVGSFAGVNELMKCTSRSGDILTVVRGQEGTSALTWNVNASINLTVTAGNLQDIWTLLQASGSSVKLYGAVGNGTTDDTAAIQSAISSVGSSGGGIVLFPAGTYKVSATLQLATPNVWLLGVGRVATTIQPTATFSGSAIFSVSNAAHFCGASNFRIGYASTSTTLNPSADGFQVTASRNFLVDAVDFQYLNGYMVSLLASASVYPYAPYGAQLSHLHCQGQGGGIHTQSNTQAGWDMQLWASDLNLEGVSGPLDAIFVEDSQDILLVNINGAVGQGAMSNSFLHVKGNSSTIAISNPDWGVYPGPNNAPVVYLESGSYGTPTDIRLNGGVIQGGTYALRSIGATEIGATGTAFIRAATIGVSLENSSSSYNTFVGCLFDNNGQAGTTGRYDFQVNNASDRTSLSGCFFRTSIGSSAGKVNSTMNLASGNRVEVTNCNFEGAGSITNAFASGNLPERLEGNRNVNPAGAVSVTLGASPYSLPLQPFPTLYSIVGGTVSSLQIGTTTLSGLTSGALVVPTNATLTITYTVAPTVSGTGF